MAQTKPSHSFRELWNRAREFADEQGFFLLAYDVVGSRRYNASDPEHPELGYDEERVRMFLSSLDAFHNTVNRWFGGVIPKEPVNPRKPNQMSSFVWDCGGVYLTDPAAVEPIVQLADVMLPFKLRWIVVHDEWEDEFKRFI